MEVTKSIHVERQMRVRPRHCLLTMKKGHRRFLVLDLLLQSREKSEKQKRSLLVLKLSRGPATTLSRDPEFISVALHAMDANDLATVNQRRSEGVEWHMLPGAEVRGCQNWVYG